jgi:hypothetical protein
MPFGALIAHEGRGGASGEPPVLVNPVGIAIPALSRGGPFTHSRRLPGWLFLAASRRSREDLPGLAAMRA